MTEQQQLKPTAVSKVRRAAKRASYQLDVIHDILDAGYLCHVGVHINNVTRVIPMAYWRVDNTLYIHGAKGSQLMKALAAGQQASIAVSHLDGMVMARSAFHHSMNYRSVVLFGKAQLVEDPEQKMAVLKAFMEWIAPGRWDEVRQPNAKEMGATSVLGFQLSEAAAKVRTGGPNDDEPDYELPVWAGVTPMTVHVGTPIPDDRLPAHTAIPEHIRQLITD